MHRGHTKLTAEAEERPTVWDHLHPEPGETMSACPSYASWSHSSASPALPHFWHFRISSVSRMTQTPWGYWSYCWDRALILEAITLIAVAEVALYVMFGPS